VRFVRHTLWPIAWMVGRVIGSLFSAVALVVAVRNHSTSPELLEWAVGVLLVIVVVQFVELHQRHEDIRHLSEAPEPLVAPSKELGQGSTLENSVIENSAGTGLSVIGRGHTIRGVTVRGSGMEGAYMGPEPKPQPPPLLSRWDHLREVFRLRGTN
jgi:hypothetical protein